MIRKYTISMSGGKDSTYMCHHVLEDFLKQGRLHEISGAIVFLSDWEFPQLIDHIHKVEENINAFLCANSILNEFGQRHTIRFYYEWTSFEYYMCDHQVVNKLTQEALRLNFPELYRKAIEIDARQSKPFKQKKKLEDFERDKIRTKEALQRRINKLNGG